MTTRQAQKKRQLRRSVSLSPRAFLTLKALSTSTEEPMSAAVERLIFDEAERCGVEVLGDDEARANMTAEWHRRRIDEARRENAEAFRALDAMREAFAC